MSKPTDNDLNRAIAEAIGWRNRMNVQWAEEDYGFSRGNNGWLQPGQPDYETVGKRNCPDFCQDRNALPEILDAVGEAAKATVFCRLISEGCGTMEGSAWNALNTTMRDIVEAALRALNLWKPEWDEDE